jgi:hypothetical protein
MLSNSNNYINSNNKLAKLFNPSFNSYTNQKLLMLEHKLNQDQTKSLYATCLTEFRTGCKRRSDDFCDECEEKARIKKQKNNHLLIIHTNLRGLNGNLDFANKCSMTSNISFFTECMCETQLAFDNSIYAPNKKLFSKNSIKYKKKGRPTGGLLFVLDSNLNAKFRFISRRTGIVTVNQLAIIGTYMPSYDGRPSTEIAYKKELLQIEQEKLKLESKNYEVIIIGDLNVNRVVKNYKRKESFINFLSKNEMIIQENKFDQLVDHSYFYEL